MNLNSDNRWVKLSKSIPWDELASIYYQGMNSRKGAPSIDARIVIGALIIKHMLRLDDRGTIEMINENVYMQYFLGLSAYTDKPVFDPSLFVAIRKRLDLEGFNQMNERIINKALCLNSPKAKVQKEKENENQYHVFFFEREFLHIFAFEKKTYYEFEKLLLNCSLNF